MKAKTNNNKRLIKSVVHNTRQSIKLALVPHKNNDYRPHLIRRYGLFAIVFVVIGMQLGYNGTVTGSVLGFETNITINSLLESTNKTRVSFGRSELTINDKLNQAAYLKAQDMLAQQYWAHVAPNGTQPWKWLGDVDYNYSEAGENLAKNFSTTDATMTAWLNSPGHKKNVLNANYKEVGFAIVDGELNGKQTSLVVALYGTPADTAVAGAEASFSQPDSSVQPSIWTRFLIATQSFTVAAMAGLSVIVFAIVVASIAHAYRRKLPKQLQQTWYRHHGIIKATGLTVFCLVTVFLYSGGQI